MNHARRTQLRMAKALIVEAGQMIAATHEEEANTKRPSTDVLELFEELCDNVDFAVDKIDQLVTE